VADKAESLDQKILDLKCVAERLRGLSGVSKLVLMGHSGGGTLMTAYQAIAEKGAEVFRGPEKLIRAPESLDGIPSADGLMLLDSNFGIAAMSLFSLDPAVTSEGSGLNLDPALDLFNPANGFNIEGSTYSRAFIQKFQKAQGERNRRLIRQALERLKIIESGKGRFSDDEPFIIPGAEQGFLNNKLYAQDIRLMSHTRKTWPLLKADGSVSTEVIRSVRKPENPKPLTGSYRDGTLVTTVCKYLNSYAVWTHDGYGYNEDSVYGIDWSSSYNCTLGNILCVSVPLLVMGMTGNWEYLASETIYENAASDDKTLVFMEGASHMFTPAVKCERFPGEFGDTEKRIFDYADMWLSQDGRFI
jgi:hypothetical protein